MSYKIIGKPRTSQMTRALATKFMEMDRWLRERPLSETRLQVYEKLIKEGKFRPVTWASAYCVETDTVYRVNGQHTATLASKMEPLPELYVTVEDYECDTLDDVAHLYATFDSKMMSRTSADIYLSFASTIGDLASLSRKTILTVVSGLGYATWFEQSSSKQPVERAELLVDNTDFALWAADVLNNDDKSPMNSDGSKRGSAAHILRGPVVAAMHHTWKKAKQDATKFWSEVRDESAPNREETTRKLARFLLQCTMKGSTERRNPVSNREMFARCLTGWNAWRKGEETALKYFPNAKLPVAK